MTDGSFSKDGTAMAHFPFSNSIGFRPERMKKTKEPFGARRHQGKTRLCFSIATFSPSLFVHVRVVRVYVGSFSSRFCSSNRATTFVRRSIVGLVPGCSNA